MANRTQKQRRVRDWSKGYCEPRVDSHDEPEEEQEVKAQTKTRLLLSPDARKHRPKRRLQPQRKK